MCDDGSRVDDGPGEIDDTWPYEEEEVFLIHVSDGGGCVAKFESQVLPRERTRLVASCEMPGRKVPTSWG